MFTGLKEQTERKNSKKVAVGYDLGKAASQISYCVLDTKEAVSTNGFTEKKH